ncbi:hypothetical protein AGR13a_Lc120049 [Agrobacterium genomosp. 13 str. CFBP 6927]|uniref:Uncharacterized protein n=1 Tax=Agrobacterium genomosp. 13 str. CFBP 6927 TaxID=1183428 RepID=A0ABM9VKH0_9HYPH|nr:hypothetical protein AGR13a_Lc120049 [Agrobacterium genomosp. 13 str. CFBP 6927]
MGILYSPCNTGSDTIASHFDIAAKFARLSFLRHPRVKPEDGVEYIGAVIDLRHPRPK